MDASSAEAQAGRTATAPRRPASEADGPGRTEPDAATPDIRPSPVPEPDARYGPADGTRRPSPFPLPPRPEVPSARAGAPEPPRP
ncbi:hypothetical protein J7E87_07690, partial [Streptomyces sp. ISL-1]|nr:hypothetical protein [Streptomyces sp. ISL-1]